MRQCVIGGYRAQNETRTCGTPCHIRFCLAWSVICVWSLLFLLCGIATLVPELLFLQDKGLQASHRCDDRRLTCMFSCDEPVVRLPAEPCKPIVLLEMSKALCWLLLYISNNMASANEGGPAGNCTSLRGSFVPSMAATSCATVASRRHCPVMRGHNIQNMCCSCQTLYPRDVEVFCCRCGVPHLLLPSPSLLQRLWNNECASDVKWKWLSPW